MAKYVDHDQRRSLILERAADLFAEYGYSNVTYKKVADGCGLSRTTLYQYFETKQEIFKESIAQLARHIGRDIAVITDDETLSYSDKLSFTIDALEKGLNAKGRLVCAVCVYLIGVRQRGEDVEHRVQRYTLRTKRLLLHLLEKGQRCGEFSAEMNGPAMCHAIYCQLEAQVLRAGLTGGGNHDELQAAKTELLRCIQAD